MKKQPKLLAVLVSAGLLAGCAGGGGSGGSGPGGDAGRPPARAQSEPSACGTVNGRPVQCVPSQRAAIDAAMNAASQASMPSAETFEALGMYAPPGAQRSSSASKTSSSTPKPGTGSDSTGLGFQYQSFGAWNSKNTQFSSGISASSGGQPTPASAVPGSGSARFTGNLIGIYVSPSGRDSTARATVVLDANFSSRSLGFASANTTLNGSAAPRLDLNGTLTYAPGSSNFAGTLRSAGGTLSGSASGVFYGPRAEEAGGTLSLKSGGAEKLTGAYGAKR